ncbi:hypothetical protein P7M10_23370 [Vibrio parahaemolyticus]|nr:hypothetical protein [Vibrio parahaemolyticus]
MAFLVCGCFGVEVPC